MRYLKTSLFITGLAAFAFVGCGDKSSKNQSSSHESTKHDETLGSEADSFTAENASDFTLCGEMHTALPLKEGEICPSMTEHELTTHTFQLETEEESRELNYQFVDGLAITEGDIILGTEEEMQDDLSIQAGMTTTRLWPNGIVYYSINPYLPNQSRVNNAIAHWQSRTGLRFIRRTNQRDFVYFTTGSGCSSWIGRVGGRQNINLANSCSLGNTIHEIGHAVGMWHEQSRTDRNSFVRIIWANITNGYSSQFNTFAARGNANVGAYDYNSIMHYGSYFFSRNGRPTMTRMNGNIIYAQRTGLSAGDIAAVRRMYGR